MNQSARQCSSNSLILCATTSGDGIAWYVSAALGVIPKEMEVIEMPYLRFELRHIIVRKRMANQRNQFLRSRSALSKHIYSEALQAVLLNSKVMKYISPQYWDAANDLIKELDLELVGVTRL